MNYLKKNYMIVLDAKFVTKGKSRAVLINCPEQQQKEKFVYEQHYF